MKDSIQYVSLHRMAEKVVLANEYKAWQSHSGVMSVLKAHHIQKWPIHRRSSFFFFVFFFFQIEFLTSSEFTKKITLIMICGCRKIIL